MDLLEKLLEIAREVDHIGKTGRNDHHKYDYVEADAVTRAIREKLHAHKIFVIPGARNPQHFAETGGKGFVTTVDLEYTFHDLESGQTAKLEWVGAGADTGGDKGLYKAYTGGLKYALLNLFMISTGEDPERDNMTESGQQDHTSVDAARPASPQIPLDRARTILERAVGVGLAGMDGEGTTFKVTLDPVLKGKLSLVGVNTGKIADLNVDQAEDVEAFLAAEEERNGYA